MQFKRKVKVGIFATTSALVLGLVAAPSVNHVLHAASDNVTTVSQTAAPTTVKAADQTVKATSASGTKSNYSVSYVKSGTSSKTATYKKTAYNSKSDAKDEVDYIGAAKGSTVSLGNGTTAKLQGTMGRVYIHWNTNNWSVTAIANTADVQANPAKFAKQVNNQLTSQKLTDTNVTHGSVTVYDQTQSGQANTVKWQQSDKVTQVKGQQASTVMKLAADAQSN
ncbi:hypothetical protein [Lactiplantibacillus mudanjiangensis]|uniref:Extracellular protein n=1 Tax=Lactiplantibacillus mudanjiangensis TaxID=1296538 RepID=A0A660E044_9LACO|nr:hypothetical protein [Lactiplantibacillus mudanjiangensis]VDG19998.1 hypothetical protein [Lactobacillus sp. CBA3605] [Lactiplantibacillus mudanjiangensis]VDG26160.1 hypothetical protein [Lactobacillus sp. CBA3605] [Lactiplantibacillus mudanjiangensis]VDG27310.1 hypothetical protein [Lactobacillus sp. CBA3605] [Lactiplantibacillus mudanjiangensis]VDG33393.1 hypothetical protein [Lactobacillus sp. CBA3605] [Lactiplantibacillus mudanjiangensis]